MIAAPGGDKPEIVARLLVGEWGQIKISSMRAPLWIREAGGGGALEGGPANWELEMVLTLVQKARAATKCRAHSGRLPADSRREVF